MRAAPDNDLLGQFVLVVIAVTIALVWWGVRKEHRRLAQKGKRLCRVCGYDLRASPAQCPECGASVAEQVAQEPVELDPQKLREDWPASPIAPLPPAVPDEAEIVHRTGKAVEADLVSEQLRSRGIWAVVKSKDTYEQAGYVADRVALFAVAVPPAEAEAARAILGRFRKRIAALDLDQR